MKCCPTLKGPKYNYFKHSLLPWMAAIAGTAWIVEGVLGFLEPSQEFRLYIQYSYLIIFGVLTYVLLFLEVAFVRRELAFANTSAGKSIIFVFVTELTWGYSFWEIFTTIFTASVGISYIALSICGREYSKEKTLDIIHAHSPMNAHENKMSKSSPLIISTPVGGHTVLLMQHTKNPRSRIWSEYESLSQALDAVIEKFEMELENSQDKSEININYDVQQLFAYVDNLEGLAVMLLDSRAQTYMSKSKKWIKDKILAQLQGQLGSIVQLSPTK